MVDDEPGKLETLLPGRGERVAFRGLVDKLRDLHQALERDTA
jgi:hypothetical protein